jgi:hypothetical protein
MTSPMPTMTGMRSGESEVAAMAFPCCDLTVCCFSLE